MPSILVVEDEPSIADALVYALKTDGFHVTHARTLDEARRLLETRDFDLAILDVGLPDGNGFELCKAIRRDPAFRSNDLPILFLTARSAEIDRIVGLEIGGDDYVTKPFSPREVTARVRVILKRTAGQARGSNQAETAATTAGADPSAGATDALQGSRFQIDDAKKRISFRGQALELSRYEYGLLKLLAENPGRVYSRAQLMDLVWEEPEMSLDRTVDAHVKMLRQKLREIAPDEDPIVTHRGLGYSLAEDK